MFGLSRMFDSHAEIDRSSVFGASLRTRFEHKVQRRSVKLFGHSRTLRIFSSLKHFDYPLFSPLFFSSRSNTLTYAIIHTHSRMHTHTFYFFVSSFIFFPFSHFSLSIYFKRLIRKSTDIHSEREVLCVKK